MASLPPTVINTIKLDSEFKKHSFSSIQFDKDYYKSIKELDKANNSYNLEVNNGSSKIESSSYIPLLQECMDRKSVTFADSVHAQIIKYGFGQELFLLTFLINVYAKCGTMEVAEKLFRNMPKRNVVTWTTLMSGYVQNSCPELAFGLFKEMLDVGCYPTNYTLGVALNACTTMCDVTLGKQVHGYVIKYDLEHDTSIGNAITSLYCKCSYLDMSIKAFRRIEEKNVISWTTVVSSCGNNGNSAMGLDMFVEMLVDGVVPNAVTLTSILGLCCTMQDLRMGSQVHSYSIKLGYTSDLPVTNSLMYLYLKSGYVLEANRLFESMDTLNIVAWNSIIAGHGEMTSLPGSGLSANFYGMEALKIFKRMNTSGLRPDMYTLSSVLTICSGLMAMEQGEQVHAQTIKSGFLSDVIVGTALVNMYNKCGSIDRASKAFVEIPMRTLISWTSMITAFAQHGIPQKAFDLLNDMRFVGVKPNKITFTGVLSACSQLGHVDLAMLYFDMMKNEYNINPVMDHYACLIDMFVRLGQIEEAFDFIKKEGLTPSEFIWSNLIAGCRSQGKLELAFYAAEQLLKLRPKDSETYFLLLNMYLSERRWTDVSRLRKIMKDEKVNKLVDWSWISIRGKVYSFQHGDRKRKSDEVEKHLEILLDKASVIGYRVEKDVDIVDEESGGTGVSTDHHSEKLAVAFGLLNTVNGATILINKSVSMCKDCHEFIKVVSAVTSRTIIIRDSKRLHKFRGGECSCGEFGRGLV